MTKTLVALEGVSMRFNLDQNRVDNLKELVIRKLKGNLQFDEFWALKNINLQIKRGQSLGLLGLNGSGKSTLLKIIAGVMKPTVGRVTVNGSVAPMIELGAGFDYELTVRENIYLNGALLGYNRQEIAEHFDELIDFAELRTFRDVPLKNLSSGMMARLGFAASTMSNPDLVIADEVLSVGDLPFQQKCERRIGEMVDRGATVILVSHSVEMIRQLCASAVWLESGKLIKRGAASEVCDSYLASMAK